MDISFLISPLLRDWKLKWTNFVVAGLLLMSSHPLTAQQTDTTQRAVTIATDTLTDLVSEGNGQFKAVETKGPKFGIYKDNYMLIGTSIGSGQGPTATNSDVKFQISIRIRLTKLKLIWGSYLFLTYTQKSFWDIFRPSFPFRESNYNPGIQLRKSFYTPRGKTKAYGVLELEHESNGQDSLKNRSWNRLSLTYMRVGKRFSIGGKLWYPIDVAQGYDQSGYGGNPFMVRYVGYGELMAYWKPFRQGKLILDATFRKGTGKIGYYSLVSGLRFKPHKWGTYLYLQHFIGYGESMVDYQQFAHKIRAGLVITPTSLIFR